MGGNPVNFIGYTVRWDDPNNDGLALFLSYERAMQCCVKKHGTIYGIIEIPLNDTGFNEVKNGKEET
jgi:hypothetical protein